MKISSINTKKRLVEKYNKQDGIYTYGNDNAYPQRVKEIIANSGTATACAQLYAKFLVGGGFKDKKFYKALVSENLTNDKLLRAICDDFTKPGKGFAIHITYNAILEKTEFKHIPFEFCRRGKKDSEDFAGKIIVYNNWDKSESGKIEKKKFDIIDVYNPRPKVVQYQIDQAGGIEKYKGQIFYYSAEGNLYPKSIFDPVLEDIKTDSELKNFRHRNVTSNFMASHIFEVPYKFETPEERQAVVESIEQFQGAEQTNKVMLIENDHADQGQAIKITKLDTQNFDKMFESTTRTTKDSIIECCGIPPVLLGVAVSGKLGTADEIRDAFSFFNNVTEQDRLIIEEVFEEIYSDTKFNTSGDYSIIPLSFGEVTPMQRIGSYMPQFLEIVSSTTLDRDTKKNILKGLFGFSDLEVEGFVNSPISTPMAKVS